VAGVLCAWGRGGSNDASRGAPNPSTPRNSSPHSEPCRPSALQPLLTAPRQEAYANWYPEDATFQPKLVSQGGSLRRVSKRSGAGAAPSPEPASGLPLVARLYASYEKVPGGAWVLKVHSVA
jgi:hypothetical protein